MRAEVVSIGTELLLGQIVDTNAAYLARRLAEVGYEAYFRQTVGDNLRRATLAVSLALERSNVVIITGGLGPTQDDVTRDVVAAATGSPLEESAGALAQVQRYFERVGREMSPSQRRQALVPRGAQVIANPVGTAPGFIWESGDRAVVALPGVPAELEAMVEASVIPFLRAHSARHGAEGIIRSRVLRFTGIGEAALEQRLADLIDAQTDPTLAPYAGMGEVSVRITARAGTAAQAQSAIESVERQVVERAGEWLYGYDDDSLERVVVRLLEQRRYTIAVAESCTGGLIGDRLTDVPGISAWLLEDVVAYANAAKVNRLDVPEEVLRLHGAVSEPCAVAMAEGVRRRAGSEVGLSTTGIAGPTGGSAEKPVGLVFVAVATPGGTAVRSHRFGGDRRQIKRRAAQAALDLLWRTLSGRP